MTLIRDYATYYPDLSDAMYEVNNELYKGNIKELFVGCLLEKLIQKPENYVILMQVTRIH